MSESKRRSLIRIGAVPALAGFIAVFIAIAPSARGGRPSEDASHKYKPSRPEVWTEIESYIKDGKSDRIFGLPTPQSTNSSDLAEWKVAIAKALVAQGQPLHAQYILSTLVSQSVATGQGFEALYVLNEIAKANPVDETQMEELAFDLDTKIEEAEPKAMMAYYKARALQRKGYADWSAQALKDVLPETAWSDELDYDRTLQVLQSGDAATAYGNFEAITKSPHARKPTVMLSRLALARLIFERRDYKAAIDMFRQADLPTREKARAFHELAWTYYYDKQYGKALGAIRALRTTYFNQLLTPETSLLEMLIYRELCQYTRVKVLAKDFQKTFSDVYRAIEDRLPLENSPRVIQSALQEGVMQKRAHVVQALRRERREIMKQSWADEALRDEVIKAGEHHERMTDLEVQRLIRAKSDEIGNAFLDIREQVWYLEYEASLRMIQLQATGTPDYEPPERDTIATDNFFWPASGREAWYDELLDYEILTKGRCQVDPNGGEK